MSIVRFFRQTSAYTLLAITTKVMNILILVPLLTRMLPQQHYGAQDLIGVAIGITFLFLSLGLNGATGRFLNMTKENEVQRRYESGTFNLYLMITLLGGTAYWLARNWWYHALFPLTDEYRLAVDLAVAAMFLSVLSDFIAAVLQYNFKVRQYIALTAGRQLLTLSFTVVLVLIAADKITAIYLAQAVAAALALAISLALFAHRYRPYWVVSYWRQVLAYGVPVAMGGLCYQLLLYADRIFLQRYQGLTDVAVYSVACTIAGVVNLLSQGFQTAWHPYVLRLQLETDISPFINKVMGYYALAMSFVVLAATYFGPLAIRILATAAYGDAYRYIPLIGYSFMFYMIGLFIFGIGIFVGRQTYIQLFLTIMVTMINIACNFLMIPRWGIMGAAVATLLSFVLFCGMCYMVGTRRYGYRFNLRPLGLLLMLNLAWLAAGVPLRALPPLIGGVGYGILLAGFVGIGYRLGLFDYNAVRQVWLTVSRHASHS